MSKLSDLHRASLEDFPGAPPWFEPYLQFQNAFNEDVHGRINGDIGEVNTTSRTKLVRGCKHGEEQTFLCPISGRPVGLKAVDTSGLPVSGLTWRYISRPGQSAQIGVTVRYDNSGETTGIVGESQSISRLNSAAAAMVSGTALNVCATPSITLSAGDYLVTAATVFNPAATTNATRLNMAVATTSATLPATDAEGVPVSDEFRASWSNSGNVIVQPYTLSIPPYPVTVADGATKTLFLVARATFTVSTMGVGGWLYAYRSKPYLTGYSANVTFEVMGG